MQIVWVAVTVLCFACAIALYRICKGNALAHPLITTVGLVMLILWATDSYLPSYLHNTKALHWLLGPATIALAVPLYQYLRHARLLGPKLLIPVIIGGLTAPLIALAMFSAFDLSTELVASVLPKSITTPLAMEVSEIIGGIPAITAVFVVVTGIIGAIGCGLVFSLIQPLSEESKGIALGTVAHAVGTAQAFMISEKTGAFASIALCINGIITSIALPILYFVLT